MNKIQATLGTSRSLDTYRSLLKFTPIAIEFITHTNPLVAPDASSDNPATGTTETSCHGGSPATLPVLRSIWIRSRAGMHLGGFRPWPVHPGANANHYCPDPGVNPREHSHLHLRFSTGGSALQAEMAPAPQIIVATRGRSETLEAAGFMELADGEGFEPRCRRDPFFGAGPDISRRRTMHYKSSQYVNRLARTPRVSGCAQFVLFGFTRSPLQFSYRKMARFTRIKASPRSNRYLRSPPERIRSDPPRAPPGCDRRIRTLRAQAARPEILCTAGPF